MRVKKILNNSLVLVENNLKQDEIFMGKGLSFRTKVGNTISPSEAEKIFVSNGDSLTFNMMQLVENVDIIESCQEEAKCAKKINIYIQEHFGLMLTNQEEMYLVLHIHRLYNGQSN